MQDYIDEMHITCKKVAFPKAKGRIPEENGLSKIM